MSAIRIRKHLDSDTLHLPELRGMIGRDVDIVVSDVPTLSDEAGRAFWKSKNIDQLAAEQGYKGPVAFEDLLGDLPSDAFDGFDEFLQALRDVPRRAESE